MPLDSLVSRRSDGFPSTRAAPLHAQKPLTQVERDIPEGFVLVGQERIDNRVAAGEYSEPERRLADFETWGKIEGIEVEFESGDEEDSIRESPGNRLLPARPVFVLIGEVSIMVGLGPTEFGLV